MNYIVISKVKYTGSNKSAIHAVGLKMLPIAKKQTGFISIAFHQSCESNETMMYWEGESKAHHDACMESSDWLEIMEQSKPIFEVEGTEFSLETFERLA